MRNLKRALSLVLAMVMLLGMLTIPTGAASNFADADQIVNTKAVDITAGMGLFAGSDGNFNPKGTVTRAQMATIIVKMLYGSDFNADSFKGAGNPFPDTAAFESGWAEGYINACYQTGVVKGYGDGTFKPGNQVTTAEAVTMIINALKVDAGEGEWPATVMAKANEMKLFGDLSPVPATNDAMIRDQLAVVVLEGLMYSPSGSSGYQIDGMPYVFDTLAEAIKVVTKPQSGKTLADISPVVGNDTLAKSVFNMDEATGFITDNQATGQDFTKVGSKYYDTQTGLDMIGHYVTVYYQLPASGKAVEAYEVYAVVDNSEVFTVSEKIENSSLNYKAVFGKGYDLAEAVLVFDNRYNVVDTEATAIAGYTKGSAAEAGTYIVNEGAIVAYVPKPAQTATYISSISEFDGEKTYMLGGEMNTISEENITLYLGAAKGDFVTYVRAKGQYVLSPVDPIKGIITRVSGNSEDGYTLTLNGQDYELFDGANHAYLADLTITVDPDRFAYGEQHTVYVTQDNKVVGWEQTEGGAGDVDVNKIVYAKGAYTEKTKDVYGVETVKTLLQAVNAEGNEVQILLAQGDMPGNYTGNTADYIEGFYVVEDYDDPTDPNNKDAKKAGIQVVTPVGIRDKRGTAVEGTSLTYSADLFYGANRWGGSTIKMPASYVNFHICTADCKMLAGGAGPKGARYHKYSDTNSDDKNTYRGIFNDSTKFLMVKGEFGEPLKCAAGDEDFSYTLTGSSAMSLPVLFAEDDSGLFDVVMVVIPKDPKDLAASYPMIYVTGEPAGATAEGDMYHAYLAQKATPMEIMVRPGTTTVTKGFKSYTIDESGWYLLEKADSDNAYEDMVINAITSSGLVNAFDPNYVQGSTEKMKTPSGANASNAVIIDLRDEENVKDSGVGELTTLDQLRTLLENGYVINADVYASDTTVNAMYITSTYKNARGVVYVTAEGKAGQPIKAIDMAGNTTWVTVNQHSSLIGFATVETQKNNVFLSEVTDDAYLMDAVSGVVTMSANGDVVINTQGGDAIKVLKDATKIVNLTALNIEVDDISTLQTITEDYGYVFSCVKNDANEASLVIITGVDDLAIADGDSVWVTADLAETEIPAFVEVELEDGSAHTVYYNNVAAPATGVPADGPMYYLVQKTGGAVTLKRSHSYVLQEGDVVYSNDPVTAGTTVQMYIINGTGKDTDTGATVEVGAQKYVAIPAGVKGADGSQNGSGGRFWQVHEGTVKWINGMYYANATQGDSTLESYKNVYGYHDTIYALDDTAITINHAPGHTGRSSSCRYNFAQSCGQTTSGDRAAAARQMEHKANVTLAADYKVLDLRTVALADPSKAVTTAEQVKALCDGENAVINCYVPDTYNLKVMVVVDPATDFSPNCDLTYEACEHGSLIVPAFGVLGETITVEVNPDAGYELVEILVDGVAIEGTSFEVTGDHTISATFAEKPKYNVSQGEAANGTLTLSQSGSLYRDTEVTVTYTPGRGYKLEAILVDGNPIEGTTFVVTGNHVVTATFVRDTTPYTVEAGTCENGSVKISVDGGAPVAKAENVTAGTPVTITATAAENYVVDEYFVDGVAIEGNTFYVTGNHTVTATFDKLYTVEDISTDGTLTITPAEGIIGTEVTVVGGTATDPNYELIAIEVDGQLQEGDTFTIAGEHKVKGIFAYVPKEGEVFFSLDAVKQGECGVAYVVDSDILTVGEDAYVYFGTAVLRHETPAAGIPSQSAGRFWQVHNGIIKRISGTYYATDNSSAGDSTLADYKYVYSYHDTITVLSGNTITVAHAAGHTGHTSNCGYNFNTACGSSGSSRNHEHAKSVTLAADYKVIDLRAAALADPSKAVTRIEDVYALCFCGNAVINGYVPGGTETSGTAEVIIVIDPYPDFTPNGIVTVVDPNPAHGTLTVEPTYGPNGTVVTVTATPEAEYDLTAILVDSEAQTMTPDGNGGFVAQFTLAGDCTVEAVFTPKPQYTVTVNYDPAHGTVTLMDGETVVNSGDKVYRDHVITVTAQPNTTYVTTIQVNGGDPIEANTHTFTVADETTVTVEFTQDLTPYTLTVDDNTAGGEVAVNVDTAATHLSGTEIIVTATPAVGHKLTAILVDGNALPESAYTDDNVAKFILTDHHTVSATFEEKTKYLVSVGTVTDGSVKLMDGGIDVTNTEVYEDTVITVVATPTNGYELYELEAGTTDIKEAKSFTVSAATEVTATFLYDLQDGDVVFLVERLDADSVKTGIVAHSVNGVAAGTVVKYVAPNGSGKAYQTYRMAHMVGGSFAVPQAVGVKTHMASLEYKYGVHEAITKVENGTFTLGAFVNGTHGITGGTCPWCNTYSPKYSSDGYFMSSYATKYKDGNEHGFAKDTWDGICESGINAFECAAEQKYDANTVIIDLRDYFAAETKSTSLIKPIEITELSTLIDQNIMVDVYVHDGAESASGTASLIVVLPASPN